ncbi:MAG: glutaredoxin family protein [Burkholderiales bacterium]
MPTLTLLSRSYCHLCDDMREALTPLAHRFGATVEEVDVDAFPDLEATYGDLVPVLLLGAPPDGVALCHYHLDRDAVAAALAKLAGTPPIG